ncbi:MAG: hypothetical protein KDA48_08955 [Amphiplicatus sp.]|nr:hypothetical protein [Amphiplicatus sp.]MCB9954838.1 hypothetical protein [Caulobacterales bacterium]
MTNGRKLGRKLMRGWKLAALAGAGLLSACATVAKVTLEDRFQAIGIPAGTAECMVDDLDQNLSDEDLQDLARYTIGLSRANSTMAAVRSLMKIDNPRAVVAIGRAGVSCVTGFAL